MHVAASHSVMDFQCCDELRLTTLSILDTARRLDAFQYRLAGYLHFFPNVLAFQSFDWYEVNIYLPQLLQSGLIADLAESRMDVLFHDYTLQLCCRQLLQTCSVTTTAFISSPQCRGIAYGPNHRHHMVSGNDTLVTCWRVDRYCSLLDLYPAGIAPKRCNARMSCHADEPGCMTGSSSCQWVQHISLHPRVWLASA